MQNVALAERVFMLETELETVLARVSGEMISLQDENKRLKEENVRLNANHLEIVTPEISSKWKEEASELLLLQRETLRELQRKYRRALLYADELQKRLNSI